MERPEEQNKGIVLKEYGRNTQKIVNYILKIEDREKRSRYAKTLVELMKQINPAMRDAQDYYGKLWDHLYIMSGFELDVDTQFPMPEKALLGKKPMTVAYNMHNLRFKHYGRNIELMIKKAIEMTDEEEKYAAILYIGKMMKRFYASWNKENVDDEVIVGHLASMSQNKLVIAVEKVKAGNLFDSNTREYSGNNSIGNTNGNGNLSSREAPIFKPNNSGGQFKRNNSNNKNNNNKDKRKRNP